LSKSRSFPCVDYRWAIRCWKNNGLCFGNGELRVFHGPFNEPNACLSQANESIYKIPVNSEGINMLTNIKSDKNNWCYFTITEIEVWGVTFSE
jgi:hypothetical protein